VLPVCTRKTERTARITPWGGRSQRKEFGFSGNIVAWSAEDERLPLELAYAMTVHKAQGSGYDTVLIPLSEEQMGNMLSRNLFYTAISRAKERVILFGTEEAIDRALRTRPSPRNSHLAEKTQKYLNGEQTTETDNMKEERQHEN